MDTNDMRTAVRNVIALFFDERKVRYAEQKMAKPSDPYVTVKFDNVQKTQFAIKERNRDEVDSHWKLNCTAEVNLFTNGKPVGNNFENTAMGDFQELVYFLESDAVVDKLSTYGITMVLDSPIRDISGIINETKYKYRANATFRVYYTETTYGRFLQGGRTVPNASGGNKAEYVNAETGYFTTVEIQEESNE